MERSVLKRQERRPAEITHVAPSQAAGQEQGRFLFTTKTCPNCKLAKEYLKGVDYEVVDAQENMELATRYGIMQAPTLVVQENGMIQKYVGAPKILGYAKQQKVLLA